MKNEIIGKGTWIDKVARILVQRENELHRSTDLIKVESGIGASGIPHIGSLGDAVRAYGVSLALQNMGYNSRLIAYSDDLDGLRKIPSGLPEWLNDYLAKPVSNIPDPFGDCHNSYGAHMSSLLLDGLDKLNVEYDFVNASQTYGNALLSLQIHKILANNLELGEKISEAVGQDKYKDSLPYFPVCESCGRLYVAKAKKYFSDEKKVTYSCIGTKLGNNELKGCGYSGEIPISENKGKLAWKVEFAARWNALDIRFEAYGKDIMDSVRVNDWVSDNILNYPHPLHVKYEMFLDKGGKKISKSSGNVLTPQTWLRYGTAHSLLLLLFKRISGTRNISIDEIPALMDEYDLYEDLFFGKKREANIEKLVRIKGTYEYINHLRPPISSPDHVPYRIMVQQASLFSGEGRIKKIYDRLSKYGLVSHLSSELSKKIICTCNWADEYNTSDEKYYIQLTDDEKNALSDIIQKIMEFSGKEQEQTPEIQQELQNTIYQTARSHNVEPKTFFKLMYKMLINSESGPKLGSYILDLGIERTCAIFSAY